MRRALLAIPLVWVLVSCATSPTGRTQLLVVPPDMAISESRLAYAQTVREMMLAGDLLHDPVLAERVGTITGRLVGAAVRRWPHTSGWEWSVALIDAPDTVNAWCMAGGRMAVYSGLVHRLDLSDDELANVMGHEIAHAIANHSAEQMSIALLRGLAVLAVAVETGDRSNARSADMLASIALSLPNSRTAEYEADQLGMELAAAAGYNPWAAVSLWEKMGAMRGSPGLLEFLSTHPNPSNRSTRLATLANQLQTRPQSTPPVPYPHLTLPTNREV